MLNRRSRIRINNSPSTKGGFGLVGVLQTIFVVLKLFKIITWSWLWVLSPLWISTALSLIMLGIFIIFESKDSRW